MLTPLHIVMAIALPCAVSAGAQPHTADSCSSREESLVPGAKRIYSLTVSAGDFIRVEVEPRDLPFAVSVRTPSGNEMLRAEDTSGESPLHLSTVAEIAGSYAIEVAALPRDAPAGFYRIVIHPPHAATETDRAWVLADAAQGDAQALAAKGTAESRQRAIERYRETRALWNRLGQVRYEAEALNEIGVLQFEMGATADASAVLKEALSLWERVDDPGQMAATLGNLGSIELRTGNRFKALEYYERAGPLIARARFTRAEAVRLNNIGTVYQALGEPRRALDYYSRSLPLRQQLGDVAAQATALMNIGVARRMLGERDRALAAYEEALPLARAANNRVIEAFVLNNLGALLLAIGEVDRAVVRLERGAALSREAGQRGGEAYALGALGMACLSQKDYARAEKYLSQALAARRAMNDRYWESHELIELAVVYRLQGRADAAENALTTGLEIKRAIGDRFGEAAGLIELANLRIQVDRRAEARVLLEQAIAISRAAEDPSSESNALVRLAELERREGDLAAARRNAEAAIALFEGLRTRVAGAESRASFFVSAQDAYELELDLLAAMAGTAPDEDLPGRALEISERRRARSLLDSLSEETSEIVAGVDAGLRRQETELADRLRTLTRRQQQVLSRPHTDEQATALSRELQDVIGQHQAVQEKLRAGNPAYQAFLAGTTASASEVQQLLDADTVLLEFSLGERASYAWVVTRERVLQVPLPSRAEISERARAGFEALSRPSRGAVDTRRAATAARALSDILLAPIAADLTQRRIAIVGDEILQRVPWAVLPDPDAPHRGRPLIAGHEVVLLPSASILKAVRAAPSRSAAAGKSVAVLADPVFERDDPRLHGTRSARAAAPVRDPPPSLVRAARDAGFGEKGFPRLPFSRQEAAAITAAAPRGSVLRALGFDASRDTALSPALADFRIVHFATHGFMDDEHPGRSGIVLSLFDRDGRPRDGFLGVQDLYNLRLNADLVVLSACRSALGKELRGEGLLGIVRGFMYAGTPRVVAAVWNVDDRATAALMREFYRSMLIERHSPAAALRQAQMAIRARRAWRDPFYWAGFVLEGEWR